MKADDWMRKVEEWMLHCSDDELLEELDSMKEDPKAMEDAFCRDLQFGTGGLRGILGVGSNRMNRYTVARATHGLAKWLLGQKETGRCSVAIGYDSRHGSEEFALEAAEELAKAGISVWMYPRLMPTPCLSFAVRRLGCDAGVMITASHNPAVYNGYKVYGADGCQITDKAAEEIQKQIDRTPIFSEKDGNTLEEDVLRGEIRCIPEQTIEEYLEAVKQQSLREKEQKQIHIIYTPLHGTGLWPVLHMFRKCGFEHVKVVEEQCKPDGDFPTCACPNPEDAAVLAWGVRQAKKENADLVLATDPDCDRVAAAVRRSDGNYVQLTGNETGLLLLEYLCARKQESGCLPVNAVVLKTIVTSELAKKIGKAYGVQVREVLTGFKYIGEQIGMLESEKREEAFLFGMEDSCGYLSGTYVRDKDGVLGAMLIAEMADFYLQQGSDLVQELERIYLRYGYCKDSLLSYEMSGPEGMSRINEIMERFRKEGSRYLEAAETLDYSKGMKQLPRSNVLKYLLKDESTVTVRPSGTEPKLKIYLAIAAADREEASVKEYILKERLEAFLFGKT